jgi:hypothetical protein
MATKVRKLSSLVDDQLPKFISSEYPQFSAFMQKYYEQLELPGQPIDLINNLTKYHDIDTYEKTILQQNTTLTSNISATSTTINVADTSSFPDTNGYILIEDEAVFYKTKTATSFVDCYRNINATTKLGDLYSKSDITNVEYADLGTGTEHLSGKIVSNISNLFLYSLIKNFESQYLGDFPEKDLKPEVDKTLLIKNIKKFYQSKGTDQSIRFLFNSIIAKDPTDVPSVYYPRESTFKSSSGEWIDNYSLKVRVISGDVTKLIGEKITQPENTFDSSIKTAFAIVDNVKDIGDGFYELILSESSVVGEFSVASQTFLTKFLSGSDGANKNIYVYSTTGWNSLSGQLLIGNEVVNYKSKNVNQFTIESRGSSPQSHPVNTPVYDFSLVTGSYVDTFGASQEVKLLVFGVIYSLNIDSNVPYSQENDLVQYSRSGFETRNRIIFDNANNDVRWKINETYSAPTSSNTSISSDLQQTISEVSAIYEDEQYYYITSSGYPSHAIGLNSWSQTLQDQKHLKLIRKYPSITTEIYETPYTDIGILVNGVTIRGAKDTEKVIFGEITNIIVTSQGSGYATAPYVLVQDGSDNIVASAKAIMSGEVVERIDVITSGSGFFPPVPKVTITSGRNAVVEAVVTGDQITGLNIINPGEYYSSPPRVIIKDSLGRGRFASYTAEISTDGKITGFVQNDRGKFYTQQNVQVIIEPVGSGATAISEVRTWRKNRYAKLQNSLDANYGYFFQNNDTSLGYGYSYLANPKSLRVSLNDNLDSLGNVPSTLSHSPILGYAYDGNPIYGPYGYSNPTNASSSISRMRSSYSLNISRSGGPSLSDYPLGSFIEDYSYSHRSGDLDQNNGRFCITPEYPEGTYAYFLTITAGNTPVYPYFIGSNYYSIPVDSNYNKSISQKDLPKKVSRLKTQSTPENGSSIFAYVDSIKSGSVTSATCDYSTNTFGNGSIVEVDYTDTEGSGLIAKVSSVKGKNVESIESQQTKSVKITTENSCYFFSGDIVTQQSTGASGQLIGDVFDDKTLVLRNVSGTFNATNTLSSTINVINLILDNASSYTANSDVVLTNGKQSVILKVNSNKLVVASNIFSEGEPIVFSNSFSGIIANQIYYVRNPEPLAFRISSSPTGSLITLTDNLTPGSVCTSEKARGLILESSELKNNLKIKVIQGNFVVDDNFYIKSFSLSDTVGSSIVNIINLSSQIKPISINDKIAILKTSTEHKVSRGDIVDVNIIPNSSTTETTIYTRRRIYQKVKLSSPSYTKTIVDTGLGSQRVLNNGSYNITSKSWTANTSVSSGEYLTYNSLVYQVTTSGITGNVPPSHSSGAVSNGTATLTRFYAYANSNFVTTGDYASTTSGNQTFTNVELIFNDITKCRDIEGRVVGNSSDAVIGKAGNTNNARATISVTNGVVTSITITSKGKGYKQGDLLTVQNSSLDRSVTTTSTRFLILEVTHVGFSTTNTRLYLNDVQSISNNDYLQLGSEIVKVTAISNNGLYVDVLRGQKETTVVNHFNNELVSSAYEKYTLPVDFHVGNTDKDGYVLSYDENSQELVVVYGVDRVLGSINSLYSGISFFDSSTPKKLVYVKDNIENQAYKFEFSYDNINWSRNPIIDVQKYYTYKFDTSHYSLTGSFLEFSPSGNFNIISTESLRNTILPGSPGSNIKVKFGFGSYYDNGVLSTTKETSTKYVNYFYFDKAGIIDSDKSYLKLIEDPLQGSKIVTYTTPNSIVYEMSSYPKYDGSGTIAYNTNSASSVGQINSVVIENQGKEFIKIPRVYGVRPAAENECVAVVNWNSIAKNISSINIISSGKNYSKPKAILLNTDGKFAEFEIIKDSNGSISGIVTKNRGVGYNRQPDIKIIETDVKIYFSSASIGVPKSISIIENGKNYNRDTTIRKIFTTPRILVVNNFPENAFIDGEEINQYDSGVLIAKGFVTKNGWRENTNILRIEKIEGEFKENLTIVGKIKNKTAYVVKSFVGLLSDNIKSYYDNLGYYASDRSKISSDSQRIADSYFYQDYSYVIKSKTPIDVWRSLVTQTIHPAGFKVFGEVSVESEVENKIKPVQPKIDHVSFIQLWDPEKNKVTIENTHRVITQSTFNLSNLNVIRGRGSVFASTFDTGEMLSYDIKLTPDFSGYFDSNGNRSGNKTFTITLKGSNTPYSVSNVNNVILSLDGILQEPGKAFTISGTQITFAEAPLGYRSVGGQPIPLSSYREGVDSPPQKIVARIIQFKNNELNNQYFKKIKDISSQFNGIASSFPLYYEDNSPVTLSSNENLLVAIDGVLQQAGSTPLLPLDRSYYIRRTTTPNEIVFVEPPRTFESTKQSFYGVSVSGYERLLIDSRFINGINAGPFILRSAVSGKTVIVDEDRNVLVFVDGVFQQRLKNYSINGSNIIFREPIRVGQKVNILYTYGRDYQKALNAFNYETSLFFNRFIITISGNLSSDYPIEIDGATIKSNTTQGIIRTSYYNGTNTELTIDSQNKRFISSENLEIVGYNGVTKQNLVIQSSRIISIQSFEKNDDQQDILRKSIPGWLLKNSPRFRKEDFVDVGDLLKIDGESEFRTILSKSDIVTKTSYRDVDDVNSNYYGKLGTSTYNGIGYGEGLDVSANIENGKVVSLTWNKKDWDSYVTKQIYPVAAGYGYETAPQLIFVAQAQKDEGGTIIAPAQGGGAKAYAIVHDEEVIDIVLYDQGSDYLVAPKVYISRGYDVIRKQRSIDVTQIIVSMSPKIENAGTLYITSGATFDDSPQPPIITISSVVAVTPFDTDRKITSIVQKSENVKLPVQKCLNVHTSVLNLNANVSSISTSVQFFFSNGQVPIEVVSLFQNATIIKAERELTSYVRTFAKANYLLAYRSLHETGAYLDSSLSLTDKIIYVPTTEKFKSFGKLLVEDEIVSYSSKLSDRFLGVVRGVDGTTIKTHPAGAFVRQYSDDVTIIDAGVDDISTIAKLDIQYASMSSVAPSITTISQLITDPKVQNISEQITTIVQKSVDVSSSGAVNDQYTSILQVTASIQFTENKITQFITTQVESKVENVPVVNVQKLVNSITLLNSTGFADYYEESVLLTNEVIQRNNTIIILDTPFNQISQRNGNIVVVNNANAQTSYKTQYTKLSLSNSLSRYNYWYNMNVGAAFVSQLSFNDISINYNYVTIEDFDVSNFSSFTKSRNIWNLSHPSIQNSIVLANGNTNLSVSNIINVTGNTTYFPSSGYLFTGNGSTYSVVQYTGKTSTSFTGCTLYKGSNIVSSTNNIMPYSV